jgi:hypothetical protein
VSAFVLLAVIAAVAAIDVQGAPEPVRPQPALPREVIVSLSQLRAHVRPLPLPLFAVGARRPRATPVFFTEELDPRSGELDAVDPRDEDDAPVGAAPSVIVDL